MVGIVSYGAYVPLYRLERKRIAEAWSGGAPAGEKAVANDDEDSLTMGVEAAFDCLGNGEEHKIDAVFFASTTPPYREKQSASILASVLDAGEEALTIDFGNSLRAGTNAIMAAMSFIAGQPGKKVLVIVSDLRVPAPNSEMELLVGDGAAAFLLGDSELGVTLDGSYTTTSEFLDIWRRDNERYYRTWEDRFILQRGYFEVMSRGISGLMKKYELEAGDFAKAVIYAPDLRRSTEIARQMGFDPKTQLPPPLFDSMGNTGSAFVPMMLVAALEEAKAGDRLLLANYGDGCDALVLTVGERIDGLRDRRGIKRHLASKAMLANYAKYARFRLLMDLGVTLIPRVTSYLPITWRDRKQIYGLYGHKCRRCGTVQYPMQRICTQCQAKDDFDTIKLPRKGTLFTFSMSERAEVADPPWVNCIIDIEGGGRIPLGMTDRGSHEVEVGMPLEFTFRNLHAGSGYNNYFWKCRPIRA